MPDQPRSAIEPEDAGGNKDAAGDSRLKWVPLVAVPEQMEATLAAGFLESEGVPCNVESRFFTQEPTQFALLGEFILYVHEDSVERAKRLLEDRLDLPVEPRESQCLDALLDKETAEDQEEEEEE